MLKEQDYETAPCLRSGPLSKAATELVVAIRELGEGRLQSIARTWSVPYLFNAMERVFNSGAEPVRELEREIVQLSAFYRALARGALAAVGRVMVGEAPGGVGPAVESIESATGDHFGRLFKDHSTEAFWAQPGRQLKVRFERNDVPLSVFDGKEVLDLGCGSGRYALVLKELGARRVQGIDISAAGMSAGKERIQRLGIEGVCLEQGNVLSLPFSDSAFDVVFTSGVFHHTENWRLGVSEMLRVLRPKGIGIIMYLTEKPGGLFWDIIEVLRVIMLDENRELARVGLQLLGIAPERIIYLLDPLMVPICVRLTPEEITACLEEAGAIGVRRFSRGADSDRIERIHRKEPYAELKFGVGENRFVFSKR
jgi:SAM-dependent methyltransferase